MKKIIIIWLCLTLTSFSIYAQEFTLEYHIGYGLYNMSDMKNVLKSALHTNLSGVKTTDEFPGNFSHNLRMGVQINQHQFGVTYTYQNTSGQNHLADYSGEYRFKIKNTGNQLGVFYRYYFMQGKLSPFFQIAAGGIISNSSIEESIRVDKEKQNEEMTLTGINFFMQPSVGLRYSLFSQLALIGTLGYEWAPNGSLHLKGKRDMRSNYKINWSGLRFSVGIITYFKMK